MNAEIEALTQRARAENAPSGAIKELAENPLFREFIEFINLRARAAQAAHEDLNRTPEQRAEHLRLLLSLRDEIAPWLQRRREANVDLIKRNRAED